LKHSQLIISTDPVYPDDDAGEAGPEAEIRTVSFGADTHGARLDRALAELVPELSRNYLQQLIEAGAVRVNGALATKPSARVKVGDSGQVELRPTPQAQAFKPEPMALETVFEDAYLRVINKPAGLVVHPAPGNWSGTLLNGLLALDSQAALLPRAGIVHRLDKDTSGLMVVARTRAAMDALVARIAAREVSRQYLALAHRPWVGGALRTVEAPVGRDVRNRLRMAVVDLHQSGGKSARTDFELIENSEHGCWVRCVLHTGRTHQIRVHMASIGHPLVADALYGGAPAAGLARQALHAFRLGFEHPVTGEAMLFHAAPPEDLRNALASWGVSYNPAQWLTADAVLADSARRVIPNAPPSPMNRP
jgi:23S rRNA pseudouridine1911/1915/1917 synthase